MKSYPRYYIILSLFLLITACKNKPSELRFSSWQSSPTEEKVMRGILSNFEAKYPDIPYKYEPIPGNYPEKIQLMLGTNTSPDLFWLKGYTSPSYLSFDVLSPLDEYIERDTSFDMDDFYPVFRDAFMKDGKYYGIAKDFNVYVLFYNKKMFAEADIEAPPSNWQELEDISRQLTIDKDGDGKPDQYGLVIEPSHEMLMPFVYQNGGEFHDKEGNLQITEPAFEGALDYYLNLYKSGAATIPSDMGAGWNGDVMGRQQAAMCISGAWCIPYFEANFLELDYAVAVLPKGKKAATLAFSVAMVMPKQPNYPDEAWQLLSYITGKEGMRDWTKSGIALPTRKSVAKEIAFDKHPIYGVFMESVPFARLYQIQYMERWSDEMSAAMQGLFYRDVTVKETLKKLEQKIKKYKLK